MNDNLKQVLIKMFSYSPFEWSENFTKEQGWYLKHEWSQAEQDEFASWLGEFLKKNWQGISEHKPFNKRHIDKIVSEFIFMYGWKTKNI